MPAAKNRRFAAALALLALAGCGEGSRGERGYTISAAEPDLRASIAALALCPSPLDRLRIGHPRLQVNADQPGRVTITVPAGEGGTGSVLRFRLDGDKNRPKGPLRVTWRFEPAPAAELDLGPARLLNPHKLRGELDQAIARYLDYDQRRGEGLPESGKAAEARGAACRSFGRIVDAYAVISSATLRAEITRQRRRDALGWLFKDNYQLPTEGPRNADWDTEPVYDPGANYAY